MNGVYTIVNKVTGDVYVGSSVNTERRINRHKRELRSGKHFNPRLQRSYNKHGDHSFEFEVLEECSKEDVRVLEQFYVDYFRYIGVGLYNVLLDVSIAPLTNPTSKQTKEKLRKALTGKRVSEETKSRLSDVTKAQWVNPESREKLMQYHRSRVRACDKPKLTREEYLAAQAVGKARTFKVCLNGEPIEIYNLAQYCRDHDLRENRMREVIKGQRKTKYKGYTTFIEKDITTF